jgi:hypothetical protein
MKNIVGVLTVIAMALQLMIPVDKMAELSIAKLPELIKEFIAARPHRSVVGIGYMSTTTADVIQNFTLIMILL